MNKPTETEQTVTPSATEEVLEMSTAERLLRSFGPLAGGLLLDLTDLLTFGSVGFYLGPLIGGLLGWWLARVYGFGLTGQCISITLTVVYCTLPGTALLPLATVVFALIRFAEKRRVVKRDSAE
jgi:ABC-type nitrate/sulfonate/bicarbonate transport system permease component